MLQIKRVYDPPAITDGYRVLVDRLWPRGVSKAEAALDEWCKDVAPSKELRQWFGHKPERFAEFKSKYLDELSKNPAVPQFLETISSHKVATLLYGAKDPKINHAVVLLNFTMQKLAARH